MAFNSLKSTNTADYAAAGRAAAASAVKSFATQRTAGPDSGKLAGVLRETAASEKISAIKATEEVTKAGINAYSNPTKRGQKVAVVNDKIGRFEKQRKAGGLAAIGKLTGAGYLAATDNTKGRERPKADWQGLYKGWESKHNDIKTRHQSEFDALGPFSSPEFKPSTGVVPGKVTKGGDSFPSVASSGEGMSEGWARMSRVIKTGEGTNHDKGYNTMFTGAQFTDTSKHPRQINRSGRHASDAAGAYQFLSTTWDGAKKTLGLTDFSPQSQEKAGKYLAQQRGMNTDTVFTDKASFLKELDKIAPEWASMPTLSTGTSYYGQGGLSPDEAWRIYNGN